MLDINSKERMLYLQEQLLFQQRRIEGAEKMIENIEKEMSWSSDMCYACEHTGPTTDLVLCAIRNPLYPSKCAEQVDRESNCCDEQEPKPLWYEGKDPESFDIMDSDTVIYNLHEDILCQKEDIDLLQNTIEEQRRIIESLVTPAEEVTGKQGSSAVLLYIARLEVERDDLHQLLKQTIDVEIEVTQERDELSTHSEMLRKSLIEAVMLLKIEQGMKVEQAKIHAEVMCPKVDPRTSLQQYRDSVIDECATLADKLYLDFNANSATCATTIRTLKGTK